MTGIKQYYICMLIVFLFPLILLCQPEYQVFTGSGKRISISDLAGCFKDFDVIFMGEFHDNKAVHQFQQDILGVIDRMPELKVAVSMEMFERDVQDIINRYLNDQISTAEFLEKSRPWPNYKEDYAPVVEFSKRNKIDIIAANVPRRLAALIARTGHMDKISEKDRKHAAEKLVVLDDEYKKQFYSTITGLSHPNMPDKDNNPESDFLHRMYMAQCLKDDTMAESINNYITIHPGVHIIHFNGDFHSKGWLGTVKKLKMLNNDLKIAVVSPVIVQDIQNIDFLKEYSSLGNFILFVPNN